MKQKLTLSIDQELAAFAHQEARRSGKSISAIFSDSLRRRQQQSKASKGIKKTLTLDDVYGILKGYDIDDSKEGIAEAYAEKYLR